MGLDEVGFALAMRLVKGDMGLLLFLLFFGPSHSEDSLGGTQCTTLRTKWFWFVTVIDSP